MSEPHINEPREGLEQLLRKSTKFWWVPPSEPFRSVKNHTIVYRAFYGNEELEYLLVFNGAKSIESLIGQTTVSKTIIIPLTAITPPIELCRNQDTLYITVETPTAAPTVVVHQALLTFSPDFIAEFKRQMRPVTTPRGTSVTGEQGVSYLQFFKKQGRIMVLQCLLVQHLEAWKTPNGQSGRNINVTLEINSIFI